MSLLFSTRQLLKIVKTGVERAIETDEEGATLAVSAKQRAWMNQQLEALGIDLKQQRQEV